LRLPPARRELASREDRRAEAPQELSVGRVGDLAIALVETEAHDDEPPRRDDEEVVVVEAARGEGARRRSRPEAATCARHAVDPPVESVNAATVDSALLMPEGHRSRHLDARRRVDPFLAEKPFPVPHAALEIEEPEAGEVERGDVDRTTLVS